MRNKNDYKPNKVTDLQQYVPSYSRTRLLEGLNRNLFNRFLTKPDFFEHNGYIGQESFDSELSQIPEPTDFDQKNQLQPVITGKVGTENYHLTFKDFMRRLERQGVDVESLDIWGRSQQFNWVPPIDIDKLINYRNYYWLGNRNAIDYITIKNPKTFQKAHFEEIKLSLFSRFQNKNSVNSISDIPNATNATHGLVYEFEKNRVTIVKIDDSNVIEVETDSDFANDPPNISEFLPLDYPVVDTLDNTTIVVDAILEDVKGMLVSVIDSNNVEHLYEIQDVVVNDINGTTAITLDGYHPSNSAKVSFHAIIFAEMFNHEYVSNLTSLEYTGGETFYEIGKGLYFRKVLIDSGTQSAQTASASLQLIDLSKNFSTILDSSKEYELKILSGNNRGTYLIDSFSGNTITINDSTRFFTQSFSSYEIYELNSIESLSSPGFMQLDEASDEFIIGGVPVTKNISKLLQFLDFSKSLENDWTNTNQWVHRNQVESFSEAVQAKIPIIEYDNTIELSDTASVEYEWRYSPSQNAPYRKTSRQPKLTEIHPIEGIDVSYDSNTVISVPVKYGDLTRHLNVGDVLRFTGFSDNDGVYQITDLQFEIVGLPEKAVTRIHLNSPVSNVNDNSSGLITLTTTSFGDDLLVGYDHWEFAGIKNVTPSAIQGEINPLLKEFLLAATVSTSEGRLFQTHVGATWQEFTAITNVSYQGPLIELDQTLQDIALFEDYQEGDIRLYINGERRYGVFQEISQNNSDFVTAIKLDDDITITNSDRIRIELGEYFRDDLGKRSVKVKFNSDTTPYELFNLVDARKVEQQKTDINQYPLFRLFDVFGQSVRQVNSIFRFKEDSISVITPELGKRVSRDGQDFVFEQLLFKNGSTEKLLTYRNINDNEITAIWRKGNDNEIQIPEKLDSLQWDIPNSWNFNIQHENRKEVSLTAILRHFRSIILSQQSPILTGDVESKFHAIRNVNYGVGGTIKEHNDNLDVLATFTLLNSVNPIELIRFAKTAYELQVNSARSSFVQDLEGIISTNSEYYLVNYVENNDKYDQWFGDSTTFDGIFGVRNMVASAAIIGAIKPTTPTLFKLENTTYLRHHDGHISKAELSLLEKFQKFRSISKITVSTISLPNPNDFDENDFVTQLLKSENTANLYRLINGQWELLDTDDLYAKSLLKLEERLFEACSCSYPKYDFSGLEENKKLESLEELFNRHFQFMSQSSPLSNSNYDPSNPYTWNYSESVISSSPIDGSSVELGLGSWQAIYNELFNTHIPNYEPWKLQGYHQKPEWWDSHYVNTDPSVERIWTYQMWENILNGMIPSGEILPNGDISTGSTGEVTEYLYVPVNILDVPTTDGISPDDLIPPYWNSTLSPLSTIRSPFDKNVQDVIINPSNSFSFGEVGYNEWDWRSSIEYPYALMEVAYRLDPMRFVNRLLGVSFLNVGCLQVETETEKVISHKDIIFHGDVTEQNTVKKYSGLLQWLTHYNRFNGFDGEASEYRKLWTEWEIDLGYQFGNVINTESFEIRSEAIDIAPIDYDIRFKKTEGLDSFNFKAVEATLRKMPSQFSTNREVSPDWQFDLNFFSPDTNSIEYYQPERFQFRKVDNETYKIYSLDILNIGIQEQVGIKTFTYDVNLSLNTLTDFTANPVEFQISINGGTPQTVSLDSSELPTVGDVLNALNALSNDFVARIESGSLVIQSTLEGVNSSVDIVDDNFFSGLVDGNLLSSANGDQSQLPIRFGGYFDIPIVTTENLLRGSQIEITGSSELDGLYTIDRIFVNSNANFIRVFVKEDVVITQNVVDGHLIPPNSRTLPWDTGQEVYLDTTGSLPGKLLDYIPYYVIKIDDYTFQLAESSEQALNGVSIVMQTNGSGIHHVGRLRETFKPLNGRVDYAWKRFFPDTRNVAKMYGNTTISTIQGLVDVITGYEEYLNDVGVFSENDRLDNVDKNVGRARGWLLEIEKYIVWAFNIRSLRSESNVESKGTINPNTNTIETEDFVPWATGSEVSLRTTSNTVLPQILRDAINFIPLYVINNVNGKTLQLALTISDAINGKAIDLSSASGDVTVLNFKNVRARPKRFLNPFLRQFSLRHEKGLPANLLKGSNLDVVTAQRIYGISLNTLNEKHVKFYRRDNESVIKMLDTSRNLIMGGDIVLDGIEHIIIFNSRSSDDKIIYDAFLGLKTPRFFVNYVKSKDITKRPSLSGLVVNGDLMTSSIEKAINDLRYYYDTYQSFETDDSTIESRKSLGYEGRKDYMDSLGVNSKSQFIFWQGNIQAKGTNNALNAFSKHRLLEGYSIDEFWAYKLCEFGDSKKKLYPELKLNSDDVTKTELRLEFVGNTDGSSGSNYTPIRLNDRSRWRNQPDLVESLVDSPYYFNATVVGIIENAQTKVTNFLGRRFLTVPFNNLAVSITYENSQGESVLALENIDYTVMNRNLVEFIATDFQTWQNVTLVAYSYDYDSEHPSKVIDTKRPEKVIVDVPIWNPAFGHHNPIGRYPIDLSSKKDPAKYNRGENVTGNFWADDEVGKVWFDTTLAQYVPYYDSKLFTSVEERSLNWGRLADFGKINMYRWVRTEIPPDEWDFLSARDEQEQQKPMSDRVTGKVRKVVYKNTPSGWVDDSNIVINANMGMIFSFLDTSYLQPLEDYRTAVGQSSVEVEVYRNGHKIGTHNYAGFLPLAGYVFMLYQNGELQFKDYITLVKREHIPTEEELENGDYKIDVPHTAVTRYSNERNERKTIYYYWVSGMKNKKLIDGTSLTLFDATNEMEVMNRPYMFIEGFRTSGDGYGVIFGPTFDPEGNNLPVRFSQCIVKGLANTVKNDNTYVLRLVKNFTLRDQLPENSLSLKNVHREWKLFRKNQAEKIDFRLWRKVIESATGFEYINDSLDFNVPVPSLDFVTYDNFVAGASTRIGLGRRKVLLDKDVLLELLVEVLTSPSKRYMTVDIAEFLSSYDLEDPISVMQMLQFIYDNFAESEVNDIFFEILEESVRQNRQHPDFLKTSWVSVDVTNAPKRVVKNELEIPKTHPSSACFLSINND